MTLAIRMAGIMASGRGGGSVRGPFEMNIEKELREEKHRNRKEIDWRSQAIGAMSSDSVKVPKDHVELQPQDVDNAPKPDPMEEFEAIYK